MTLIPLIEAAKKMGISYQTFRRRRVRGEWKRLHFIQYGGEGRTWVTSESVEQEIKLWTNREN